MLNNDSASALVFDVLDELSVEHDGDRVGVVPEVDELVVGVAVVRVHRHEAGLPDARTSTRGTRGRCRGTARPCPALSAPASRSVRATPSALRSNSSQEITRSPWTGPERRGSAPPRPPTLSEVPARHHSSQSPRCSVPSRRTGSFRAVDFELPPDDDPRRVEVRRWLAEHPRRAGAAGRGGLRGAALAAPVGPRRRPDPPADHRRRAAPGGRQPADQPDRHRVGRPDARARRHAPSRRSATCCRCSRARRSGASCSASRAPASDLAEPRHAGRARRRRVGGQRPEDLDVAGPVLAVRHPHRPHRSRRRQAQGDLVLHLPDGRAGHRDPPDHRDDRRAHVQRGVLHRCPHTGREPGRRGQRGMGAWPR